MVKKMIATTLVSSMLLGLCGCAAGEKVEEKVEEKAALQVGFGRSDVLFTDPIGLSGGSDPKRISEAVLEPLQFTCVAMTDRKDQTVLLFTQDLQQVVLSFSEPVLQAIAQQTGVPRENILLAATHNHGAASQSMTNTGVKAFHSQYTTAMVKAAVAAMEDRSPATASIGTTNADGYVFVRHYRLENGTCAGANYGDFKSSPIVGHVWEPDTQMQMVRFEREGKKAVLLLNLGSHATFNGSTSMKNLSADFPYYLRQQIEENADVQVAYFLAAAGEQVPSTKIPEESHGLDYKGFGAAVGQLVVDALDNMTPAELGEIQLVHAEHTITVAKGDQEKLELAKEVQKAYREVSTTEALRLSREYGFVHYWEAMKIVEKQSLADTDDIAIAAMTMGDVAITLGSYEMFSANGKYIKENSPYPMTFLITMAMDHNSYIPSQIAYDINCYEAYASKAVAGSGEALAEHYVQILNEMKG